MDFPSYVPNAVRVSMTTRLEGDQHISPGWISALASAEAELLRVEQMQKEYAHDEAVSNTLRVEFAKAKEFRDQLAAEVACCHRLVQDRRMQSAYAHLMNLPDVTDSQLSGFIHAAWAAMIDYTKYRIRMAEAADLADKVAVAAGTLADLLQSADSTGWHGYFPAEFFSLPSLMEKTEHADEDRNFLMWPGMRSYILGEPEPKQAVPREQIDVPDMVRFEIIPLNNAGPQDSDAATRDMLRYAWRTAPSVSRFISTLHRAALACAPTESGFIGAALASQKKNKKFEYLRAFGALLRDEHGIALATDVMKAMVTTTNVVLNEPDLDVSYDDVRKALATIAR